MSDLPAQPKYDRTHPVKSAGKRLTESLVADIRRRYRRGGVTQNQLALEMGVSQSMISRIIRRKNWALA
jgi:DNA-binding transcriptional regulator LsrR (DeoR family)